jgi:hypothetical protein
MTWTTVSVGVVAATGIVCTAACLDGTCGGGKAVARNVRVS